MLGECPGRHNWRYIGCSSCRAGWSYKSRMDDSLAASLCFKALICSAVLHLYCLAPSPGAPVPLTVQLTCGGYQAAAIFTGAHCLSSCSLVAGASGRLLALYGNTTIGFHRPACSAVSKVLGSGSGFTAAATPPEPPAAAAAAAASLGSAGVASGTTLNSCKQQTSKHYWGLAISCHPAKSRTEAQTLTTRCCFKQCQMYLDHPLTRSSSSSSNAKAMLCKANRVKSDG